MSSMFSSALKSIQGTNISQNYTVSQHATSQAGPWRIHDAKRKNTGKVYSVFIFDKKLLDSHGSSLGRSSASAFKKVTEEVVERLKKEASSLAKLRHPSILELVEPVEETRGGGLQFVTEPVTASLASLLQEKDDQERASGVGGRSSRYVTEDSDGTRRRREIEIDELEIQKGLLQISKALEFLHENAGLSDWKISGLSFCSPPDNSSKPTSFQPMSLYEILNPDPRLPRSLQLNLDYTSPDFVLDNNLNVSADMFSLGILCVALYNSPHKSPLECNSSLSSYKRFFQSSSTIPTVNNNFQSSRPLPKDLVAHVLPRLITRRPAQRLTAKEFQETEFFDNILVSTIRFIEAFPAKTPNEKQSFLRGLSKVLPSFPKSVMEKKLLPALLDETKDKALLSLILGNVFKIIDLLPSGRRAFTDKVRPVLKDIFVTNAKQTEDKDPQRDAGLMVVLENISTIANNTPGKEFKDDMLPVVGAAIAAPTHSVVDAALRSLPVVLPVLDFSTIKNELFPVIAHVFSKTTSLAIKVRGLQAFVVLCGGSSDSADSGGLDGLDGERKKASSSTALDKYTMQEKIVPLIKVIKTKEPAVMMEALNVLRVVGDYADPEFIAMDILPILWQMSLGPLLNLKQFQSFMDLVKTLSRKVEDEQTKKLQELSGVTNGSAAGPADDFMSFGGISGTEFDVATGGTEDDFERLVKGKSGANSSANPMDATGWDETAPRSSVGSPGLRNPAATASQTAAFSWSTPSPTTAALANSVGGLKAQQGSFRTVTPDLASFGTLTPSSTQYSQPLQPSTTQSAFPPPPTTQPSTSTSVNWSAAGGATANPWSSSSTTPSLQPSRSTISPPPSTNYGGGGLNNSMASLSMNQQRPAMSTLNRSTSAFSLPPPPGSGTASPASAFSLAPPTAQQQQQQQTSTFGRPAGSMGSMMGSGNLSMSSMSSMVNKPMGSGSGMSMSSMMGGGGMAAQQQQQQQQAQQSQQSAPTGGLDKYQSLL
ncbi:hypothetical protein M406DRAFT_84616 [Cryphonectria parasitica EP155]|uniref:Protein kinase domain-containing protein n=1 Tax=Cryphonectria parasitica (strain ATCC 38755 / EP155) TaxID=660469 RepID=A0A9P4XV31_CRYP1|nr:uncharacterized protein M406DRAFT_84616 [Cryphonectria parasitica EP155]KAF3761461.1 hypothetical protein M406DRAFT_84616 [Cryphonectria parasitica EP155]